MNDASLNALRRRHWHLITHRCHVDKPGDYLRLEWFNDEIVVCQEARGFWQTPNTHRVLRLAEDFELFLSSAAG